MLIDVCVWRIPAENSKKQLEFWREALDYQGSHPEKFSYTKSRIFTLTEEGSSEETWMFIDEYEDREAYDKTMKALGIGEELGQGDPEVVRKMKEWHLQWDPLIVPGSWKIERWTERTRVEFK